MPFIPAVGVVQAELVMNWDGQIVENVLHFVPEPAPSITRMQELGAFLVAWFDGPAQNLFPSNLTLFNVKLTDLTTETSPTIDFGTGLPMVGTASTPSLPNNCSLVMTKRTLLRGRSYRGRIYHCGLVEGVVTGNAVLASPLGTFLTEYNKLVNFSTATAAWVMAVVSRYSGGFPRETAVITPVQTITSDGVVDSQRRRLPGRGS